MKKITLYLKETILILLAHGHQSDQHEPILIDRIDNQDWFQICCSSSHTIALTLNGKVYIWGSSWYGQLGQVTGSQGHVPTLVTSLCGEVITAISCGFRYTAAVTKKGDLYTWYAHDIKYYLNLDLFHPSAALVNVTKGKWVCRKARSWQL